MDVAILIQRTRFRYAISFKQEWPDPYINMMEARSEVPFSCKMERVATTCAPRATGLLSMLLANICRWTKLYHTLPHPGWT